MTTNISQNAIIDILNRYLKWHHLPIRLNTGGVCNGLAAVYAKYILEGRENDFLTMLQYIASKKIPANLSNEVDSFIAEIVLSYLPEKFNFKLDQTTSMETLQVHGKPLKALFNFSLTTSDESWQAIIRELALESNEVMRVLSINHAVSISKKGGKYIVYDPNYPEGVREFPDEESLINELHYNVFNYDEGLLGLSVQIVRDPRATPRAYPSPVDLYRRYLSKTWVNDIVSVEGRTDRILSMVAEFNDAATIQYLLENGADKESINDAAIVAARQNKPMVLKTLLPQLSRDKIEEIFATVLSFGREECFDELLKTPLCLDILRSMMSINSSLCNLITNATGKYSDIGGNAQLLKKLINLFESNHKDFLQTIATSYQSIIENEKDPAIQSELRSAQTKTISGVENEYTELTNDMNQTLAANIYKVIRSGSLDCLKFIYKKLEGTSHEITEEKKMQHLILAIRRNQPYIALFIMDGISDGALKTIKMSVNTAETADLSILQALQEREVPFTDEIKGVMAQKKHESIGVMLSMGILLNKFTDFCKEVFGAESISYDSGKCSTFKKALSEVKKEDKLEEPLPPPSSV